MKRPVIIILSVLTLLVIVFFCLPQYARKALIYRYPSITDLKLFQYNTIEAKTPQDILFDKNYNKVVIETNARREIEDLKTGAYLVMKDGKLLYEEYWNNFNDSSYTNIFSASKSIISLLIGIAIDKGYIGSINDVVSMYIPELGNDYDHITIEHLLTMSAGLDWHENNNSLFSQTTKAYYSNNLKSVLLEQKPIYKPGKEYYYSNGATGLLGLILANASKMTVSAFAAEYLWTPIGAQHDAKWSIDKKEGIEKSFCCFYSNARDLMRIGQLVLQDGIWNKKQIISKSYLEKAFTPADYLYDKDGYKVNYYGYQWWLLKYKYFNIKYARGEFGQYVISIPELNMVIVRLGEDRNDVQVGGHTKDVFLYVNTAVSLLEQKGN